MSIIRAEDEKKWINAFIALCSILAGFVVIRFVGQLGEWFDLEARIDYFLGLTQGLGILIGFVSFMFISRNKNSMNYFKEVYGQLTKVVWPDKDSVVKLTIGIVIGISIVSGILVLVDFIFRKLLAFIY
ncbi:MAG: preprotein translocase subunit SecE [Bdellovibrionales bacterium]|jgi:preprotein translocase subunit SecE|nr:preprotein translocase subunit SecE [Bdellovibrionales bacterium]MBT3525980.1 preprotein translocase subunit SecE [Bdellovibrionales bacterium]MBT7670583.1 preprotein translocase subunit SecE [Bdellovibrionales bacterium]MBT7766895.1 preprotein translocase subunit SecE [Bdellovibrionales bacterium]